MTEIEIVDITPENIDKYGVCGYKDLKKHLELRRKIDWFKEYYPKGLRIKAIISKKSGCQGMLEYIPGEYAHRPVDAAGYMFIHCIFVGFKNEFKGKGYASTLIEACINDAREQNMQGVAVVTRKGPFMANKDIFLKKGFSLCDKSKPDFELMVIKFNREADNPKFKDMSSNVDKYAKGLTIIRSAQCPYSVKNVDAILKTAREKLQIEANLIDLEDSNAAQLTPCAFGTFCIIYNGEVISHHPISNKRFENIMADKTKNN
jgi:N-acetylglutamate synthase-like GNAT family acetyltransferase